MKPPVYLLAVAFLLAGCASSSDPGLPAAPAAPVFDSRSVESAVKSGIAQQGFADATVTCPDDQPLKKGYIFDCAVTGAGTTTKIRVTEDDDSGHFTWQPTT